ncbi:MAG: NUDIX hydrolase [Janthinobacterium lividum]
MNNYICGATRAYIDFFPDEKSRLAPLLRQLEQPPELTDRNRLPGHVTASGIVRRGDSLLAIYHKTLRKWLTPGGHIDLNERPLNAAIREVVEETGMSTVPDSWHKRNAFPLDIDIHAIPANQNKGESEHLHYDFRYLLTLIKHDSREAECSWDWLPISTVPMEGLGRVIRKIVELTDTQLQERKVE